MKKKFVIFGLLKLAAIFAINAATTNQNYAAPNQNYATPSQNHTTPRTNQNYMLTPEAPPTKKPEQASQSPGPDHTWVEGHWVWNNKWHWEEGSWEKKPHKQAAWVQGHWKHKPSAGWVWIDGHWE
jgi:hypothetical protein